MDEYYSSRIQRLQKERERKLQELEKAKSETQRLEVKRERLIRQMADGAVRDWMIGYISKRYTTDELQIGMDVLILPFENISKDSEDSTSYRLAKVEPDGIMINGRLLQDPFLHKLLCYLEGEQKVAELYEGKIRKILDPTEPECIESVKRGWFLGDALVEISSTEEIFDGKIGYVRAVWLSNAYDTDGDWDSQLEYFARLPY